MFRYLEICAGLKARQIDAKVWRCISTWILKQLDLLVLGVEDLHVDAEALELVDVNFSRLRHAWRLDALALDDRLVRLHASNHVV